MGASKLRRGEIKIEGLGKRYWFRSDAPEEDEQQEEEEDLDDDERASRGFNFFFGRRAEIWALRDLFCHIEPGDRVAVIGVNGSGKSTLIRILSRTLPPSEGNNRGCRKRGAVRGVGRTHQHAAQRLR